MKLNDVHNTARHKWMGNYALKSDRSQIMPGTWGFVKEGVFIREEDGARAPLAYEDVKFIKVQRIVEEKVPTPRRPEEGHFVVERDPDGNRRAKAIVVVANGNAYIDTGRIDRKVFPLSDLEYIGHRGGNSHVWKVRGK